MNVFDLAVNGDAKRLLAHVVDNGGASLRVMGDFLWSESTTVGGRFVVGVHHDANTVLTMERVSPTFANVVADVITDITCDGIDVGLWVDGPTLHIDAIAFTDSLETALELGRANAQVAIYDLLTCEDIAV